MRFFAAIMIALATSLAANAQAPQGQKVPDKDPEAMVRFIYEQYVGKKSDDPITFRWTQKPMVDQLFEPALARAIVKAGDSEEPVIDGDPFIEAQDFLIESYTLKTEQKTADKARIAASFKNMARPTLVRLDLVRLQQGWRIRDVWSKSPRAGLRSWVKLR